MKENHSLIIFLIYIVSVNIRPNSTIIDGIVLSLLFGYVIFDKYLKYKTLPDIRTEVFEALKKHVETQNLINNKLQDSQNSKVKELEGQIKDANSAINKVINLKNVGIAGSVKF